MNNVLENLWYSHQQESPMEDSEEMKQLVKAVVKCENELKKQLSKEQWDLFQQYDKCLGEMNCISEMQAFVKGVRFATVYLLEALYP